MSKAKGKDGHKHRRQPDGLQFSLDQEAADQAQAIKETDGVIENTDGLEPVGEGYPDNNLYNGNKGIGNPPSPPTPPSPQRPRTCFYEEPATREAIRRKLDDLGVTNINQLIRSYQAADLIEAISDFEAALDEGLRIKSPTAYLKSLLL